MHAQQSLGTIIFILGHENIEGPCRIFNTKLKLKYDIPTTTKRWALGKTLLFLK